MVDDYPLPPSPRDAAPVESFPDAIGIYFVWRRPVCVYVGQATSLRSRCSNSHPNIKKGDVIAFLEIDKLSLYYAECHYIGLLKPMRNFGGQRYHFEPKHHIAIAAIERAGGSHRRAARLLGVKLSVITDAVQKSCAIKEHLAEPISLEELQPYLEQQETITFNPISAPVRWPKGGMGLKQLRGGGSSFVKIEDPLREVSRALKGSQGIRAEVVRLAECGKSDEDIAILVNLPVSAVLKLKSEPQTSLKIWGAFHELRKRKRKMKAAGASRRYYARRRAKETK